MTGNGRRAKRVAEAIRAYLSEALAREVSDPRLTTVVITKVVVSDDLSLARVSVRLLGDDEDLELRRSTLGTLRHAAGRLRRVMAPRLRLRRTPELRFDYDTGPDAVRRVEQLLHEINGEPHASDE